MVRPRWGVAALLSLALWCLLLFAGSRAASADPAPYTPPSENVTEPAPAEPLAPCPAAPGEPYGGEDHAAGEARLGRGEAAEVCGALVARLEQLRDRLWWLVAEAVEGRHQRALANERLTELGASLAQIEAVVTAPAGVPVDVGSDPLQVEDGEAEQVAAAVTAAGEATKEAIWFLVGLAVGLYASYALYRQVMPRV